jgi:hypothetical protein
VAEDQHDVLIRYGTNLLKLLAWVHLFAPVLGDNRCPGTVLGLVCHFSIHLKVIDILSISCLE